MSSSTCHPFAATDLSVGSWPLCLSAWGPFLLCAFCLISNANRDERGIICEPGTARQQVGEPRQDGNVAAVNRFSGRRTPPGTFRMFCVVLSVA